MPEPLAGKCIVLGVTGGIAAYKAADLTSRLVQLGADVYVVMTSNAVEFIGPMTFQALTRNPVYTGVFEGWLGDNAGHVTLAAKADAVVVAPATANSLAKMANGLADDMLGAVLLATQAPILLAPAMEHHMWHHPATQQNLTTLLTRGAAVVEPEPGRLASGASGDGRLAAIDRILMEVRRAVGEDGPLRARNIVITAGGTHEAIDPVRFIGNSSTGTMGIALAKAAVDFGANVTLILGPTVSQPPAGIRTVRVDSAVDMRAAVTEYTNDADALIMAAAVADFRPATIAEQKVKKVDDQETWQISLVKNPDILATVQRAGLLKIGFAAETHNLLSNAHSKLQRKGLDMIVANDAVSTIGAPDSEAVIIRADRLEPEYPPRMGKDALAALIVSYLPAMLVQRG